MSTEVTTKSGLSKSVLQIIAIITMLLDHIALTMVSNVSLYYYIMRFLGKISVVIMCFFVAEGYYKTRNLGKYLLRMGIFAAVSQIPYYMFLCNGYFIANPKGLILSVFNTRNVIFTLFIGLCLLSVIKSNYKVWIKVIATVAALYVVRNSDWDYYAILWIMGFGLIRDSKWQQGLWAAIVVVIKIAIAAPPAIASVINIGALTYGMLDWLVMFGGFLAIPFIMGYNGERGTNLKLSFYIFYPLHLLVLALIAIF